MQSPAAVKDVGGRNWVRGMENRGRKEDVQCFSLKQKCGSYSRICKIADNFPLFFGSKK